MLLVAYAEELKEHLCVFKQMYSLRAQQFSARRGWRVNVTDGLERDYFDELNPLYICVVRDDKKLLASLRILPTTGPHMLANIFPKVMGKAEIIRHPLIWESSRFCVDTKAVREFGEDGINVVTKKLLGGLFETAVRAGIHNVVSVYDVFVERILKRAGCSFERLGPVVKYDDLRTVAGLFEVSPEIIADILQNVDAHKLVKSA